MPPNILTIDDEQMIRELLVLTLSREGYACLQAQDANEAAKVLAAEKVDLALLDIMMPGKSGIDFLKELKSISPETVVVMVTGLGDINTAMDCIHMGADDFIVKPFDVDRVLLTVKNSLEKQRLTIENRTYQNNLEKQVFEQTEQIRQTMGELRTAYNNTLTALVRALDAREKETGSHSERVMAYSMLLAEKLGVDDDSIAVMAKGALLHDIGKVGVSDNILLKPGKLDSDEWLEMKKHPHLGADILTGIRYLEGPAQLIRTHHERFDGGGYPSGLSGRDIPLGSRIFALVDTLDAMTSDRPYRKALSFSNVVDEVTRCSGSQFDPEIVQVFLGISQTQWEEVGGRKFNSVAGG